MQHRTTTLAGLRRAHPQWWAMLKYDSAPITLFVEACEEAYSLGYHDILRSAEDRLARAIEMAYGPDPIATPYRQAYLVYRSER